MASAHAKLMSSTSNPDRSPLPAKAQTLLTSLALCLGSALGASPVLSLLAVGSLAGCHEGKDDKASLPPKGEAPAATPAPAGEATAKAAEAPAKPAANAAAPAAAPTPPATPEPGTAVGGAPGGAAAKASTADYRLTGQVTAVRRSQIAFRISGVIKSILVKPGVHAKAGEPLATLDERDFVLRADLAKARVDQAKVQQEEASKELKREQELKQANASTGSAYDKIKSGADQTRLGVRLAELDLENADYALRDTKLLAPYDCVIADQFKYEGEAVQPMPPAPVFEVYDTAEPEITLSVPERLMGQVKVGSQLSIIVPSSNYTGKGVVARLVPVISEKSRTFQVIAHFSNYDAKIVPGTYAEATME